MQQRITEVSHPGFNGHIFVTLEDGSKQVLQRGTHEADPPRVGELWPREENVIPMKPKRGKEQHAKTQVIEE